MFIRPGPTLAVAISIDENLADLISVQSLSDFLIIDQRLPFDSTIVPTATVTMPLLGSLRQLASYPVRVAGFTQTSPMDLFLSGGGPLSFSGDVDRLTVTSLGAGDVELAGTASRLEVEADFEGSILAREMNAQAGDIHINGSGNVTATFTGGVISVSILGSGNLDWWGSGTIEMGATTGTGTVTHH